MVGWFVEAAPEQFGRGILEMCFSGSVVRTLATQFTQLELHYYMYHTRSQQEQATGQFFASRRFLARSSSSAAGSTLAYRAYISPCDVHRHGLLSLFSRGGGGGEICCRDLLQKQDGRHRKTRHIRARGRKGEPGGWPRTENNWKLPITAKSGIQLPPADDDDTTCLD